MNDSTKYLSCGEFQSKLPDLLGSGMAFPDHPHLQSCTLCRALLADLDTIAQAARQLFPVEEPPTSIWIHIESAIVMEEAVNLRKA